MQPGSLLSVFWIDTLLYHTCTHLHPHTQTAGSCFPLPDLSSRIESHMLPVSPSSQGDTVGKATSYWTECMSVHGVYVEACTHLCPCGCECWWLVVNQRLPQGTSLSFARQKQGQRWREEERRKLEWRPLLSNAKTNHLYFQLVWSLMCMQVYLGWFSSLALFCSHTHTTYYCFSNRLWAPNYVLLLSSTFFPLPIHILKRLFKRTAMSNSNYFPILFWLLWGKERKQKLLAYCICGNMDNTEVAKWQIDIWEVALRGDMLLAQRATYRTSRLSFISSKTLFKSLI